MSHRAQGVAYLLFAILVWSGWIVLGRWSAREALTPYDITALRFGVAGVLMLPVLWKKGLSIGPWGWKGSLWLTLTMGAPYNTLTITGMQFAPASHAAALINTAMLSVTTLLGVWLLKEHATRLRLAGVALSLMGILCMLHAGQQAGGEAWRGHIMFLAGGVMWAGYTLAVRAWHADPLHATAVVCVLSMLGYMPLYLLFVPSHIGWQTLPETLFQAGYQGVLNSIIAFLCFNRGVRLMGATMSSAFLPLVPVLATLLAVPILGEVPNTLEVAGIALASAGVLLSTGALERFRRSVPALDNPRGSAINAPPAAERRHG